MQPSGEVISTEYVVLISGVAIGFALVGSSKVVAGDQR